MNFKRWLLKEEDSLHQIHVFDFDDTIASSKGQKSTPHSVFSIDVDTTKPIKQTIDRIKKLNSLGAKTMILTARSGEDDGISKDGKKIKNTNKRDILNFLSKYDAMPTNGIICANKKDKGEILYKAINKKGFKEIHFYDNLLKNINDVINVLSKKMNYPPAKDGWVSAPTNSPL